MDTLFETTVDCPYCGARFTTLVDASVGACDYIEDCAVCCRPIEFQLQLDGSEVRLLARREDDDLF
jgi:Cysteine-rich CPXCG